MIGIRNLPPVFLKARLDLTNKMINDLPVLHIGHHQGALVIREYVYANNKRMVKQYSANGEKGKVLYKLHQQRCELIDRKNNLKSILSGYPDVPELNIRKVRSCYDKSFWENIRLRADIEEVNYNYEYNGIRMCSRTEVVIAQNLDALGLQFKYEPLLIIGDEFYYPDFIVYLPELHRCFFIEFLGRLDDKKYCVKNGLKIGDYLYGGMIVDKDLLLLCGTKLRMPTSEEIAAGISSVIGNLCRDYRTV